MSNQIKDYKVGDELFRYIRGTGIFLYHVLGVRSYEDSTQLEVECQSCSHGRKCRLLIAENDYGKIVNLHMLNNDEDDDQRHWHTNEGLHFWPTKKEASDEFLQILVKEADEKVRKLEGQLAHQRKHRDELVAAVGSAV